MAGRNINQSCVDALECTGGSSGEISDDDFEPAQPCISNRLCVTKTTSILTKLCILQNVETPGWQSPPARCAERWRHINHGLSTALVCHTKNSVIGSIPY